MNPSLQSAHCPVCHHTVAVPFFEGGLQPLATLGWPTSADEAKAMPRHPHDFVQCPQCSHVWNRSFSYDAIPYEKNPNRMFNTGSIWKGHLAATRDLVLAHLSDSPTVVDVGCGEGGAEGVLGDVRDRLQVAAIAASAQRVRDPCFRRFDDTPRFPRAGGVPWIIMPAISFLGVVLDALEERQNAVLSVGHVRGVVNERQRDELHLELRRVGDV